MARKYTKEELEKFRSMTPGQRLALSMEMTAERWKKLKSQKPEYVAEVQRRLRRFKDIANERVLTALAKTKLPKVDS